MKNYFTTHDYCSECPIEKYVKAGKLDRSSEKNEIQIKTDLKEFSNVDYLILTDTIEKPNELKLLFNLILKLNIKNFVITSALGCRTYKPGTNIYSFPTPFYINYNYCKSFNINKYNPKCVITLGKAFMHFTQGDVFSTWREFSECFFNETYFYPHINLKWKGRIYPSGFLNDILFDENSFERFHFIKQLKFAKQHIQNYEKEKFIIPDWKIEKIENFDKFINDHKNKTEVALDTETNNLNVFVDDFKVGCIQHSFDGLTSYYLPFSIIKKENYSNWINNLYQIWANGKYDAKALKKENISGIHVDEDIPIIFHLMNSTRDSNSIKILAWLIGFGGYEDELDIYIKQNKTKNYLDIPENILIKYAGLDAIVTYRLYQYLKNILIPKQLEVYKLYKETIIPVIPVFQAIEEEGMLVDKEYIKKYHNILVKRLKLVEKEIYEIAGKKFNINGEDLRIILEELGLPDYGRIKKGLYETGEDILKKWKKDGYKIAEKILEYRKIIKMDNTYIGEEQSEEGLADISHNNFFDKIQTKKKIIKKEKTGIYKYIMSDKRIHGNIMPALADSWRSISLSPNLQNFPKHGEEGKEFRKIFIPPEDYYLCEADYSGFQLRLMGIFSEDSTMIDAFINKGGDLHSVTGQEVFCQNVNFDYFMQHKHEEPYKTARYNGKQMNLAFAFRQSPFSFKRKIEEEWPIEQINNYIQKNNLEIEQENGIDNIYLTVAKDIHNKFFLKYPKLETYGNKSINLAKKQGYIDCPIFPGLRRHLPFLYKKGNNLSKERKSFYSSLENMAVNSGAQGAEALIIYKAFIKIYKEIKRKNLKSKAINCVHDSIVLYIHKNEVKEMYYLLKNAMEVYEYSIPILVDIELGNIWGFGDEITEKNFVEKKIKRRRIKNNE